MPRKIRTPDRTNSPAGELPLLRIIGGTWRHRRLEYSGDLRTRPMKDRIREAVFNLVGPDVKGMHAIDLFAGTGALGLEALSRGAVRATFIEQHFPTANLIRTNAASLQAEDRVTVVPGNTFLWGRRLPPLGPEPCVVFCSPPYSFYVERQDEVLELLRRLLAAVPANSIFVVEADERFPMENLPDRDAWDVRNYPPAVVSILKMERQASELPQESPPSAENC